jgi:sulfatase maturation enzyme AslB (radical SAM superfamily)
MNPDVAVESDLHGRFCSRPWEFLEIGLSGVAWACCPAWLPKPIGKMPEQSLEQIWNSKTICEIRQSILDGSFKYCKPANCPLVATKALPRVEEISDSKLKKVIHEKITVLEHYPIYYNLCYDDSCNLSCPSCRGTRINFTHGPEYEARVKIHERLLEAVFSKPHKEFIQLNITGSGDPFGSKLFREFLTSIDGTKYPNVVFNFQTNGVMFTRKYYESISGIHKNIGQVAVSFDAATSETYSMTRRGGDWYQLLENTELINDLRKNNVVKKLSADYVVQQLNFKEMPAFISLLDRYKAIDVISFSLINNWGTYPEEEFKHHAIWKADHPEHQQFLETLRDPLLSSNLVFWGNVLPYRQKAFRTTLMKN